MGFLTEKKLCLKKGVNRSQQGPLHGTPLDLTVKIMLPITVIVNSSMSF